MHEGTECPDVCHTLAIGLLGHLLWAARQDLRGNGLCAWATERNRDTPLFPSKKHFRPRCSTGSPGALVSSGYHVHPSQHTSTGNPDSCQISRSTVRSCQGEGWLSGGAKNGLQLPSRAQNCWRKRKPGHDKSFNDARHHRNDAARTTRRLVSFVRNQGL
jgi:hypothetical protein